jgi:hypothetical protein
MARLYFDRLRTDSENAEEYLPKEVPAKLKGRRAYHEEWGDVYLALWVDGHGNRLWECSYDGEFYHPVGVVALFEDLEEEDDEGAEGS